MRFYVLTIRLALYIKQSIIYEREIKGRTYFCNFRHFFTSFGVDVNLRQFNIFKGAKGKYRFDMIGYDEVILHII